MTAPPPPDLGVYISPAQTHAEVRRVADGQIRMEAKLDAILADQREHRETIADHEQRIRRLEAGRWPLPTIAALAGIGGLVLAAVPLLQH
ncbi:hypothetical protein GCM10009759_55060 [Kitasatospora saccharophila]|uniref:DUF3618 domain-containing protein n=1 Tax=Kitasatospora saccharophila TaxID=407973 RepID=A0ABN2XIZ5_9ACTN